MNYTTTSILPRLRSDISLMKHAHDGVDYLLVYDQMRYADSPVLLTMNSIMVLDTLSKNQDVHCEFISESIFHGEIPAEAVLEIIEYLSAEKYLQNEVFFAEKQRKDEEFANSPLRKAFSAGHSYPETAEALGALLDAIKSQSEELPKRDLSAIIMPHCEIEAGALAYSKALRALEGSKKPDVVVMFATSHYGSQGQFILTDKDFETPFGITKTDKQIVDAIREAYPHRLTIDDSAHRPEHSIEIDLLMLQHSFGADSFTLVPILVTGFHHMFGTSNPKEQKVIADFIDCVRAIVEAEGKSVLFVSSGDLSHIGRKFGDNFEASDKQTEVTLFDNTLVKLLANNHAEEFYHTIADNNDQTRVCGCSPNYMMLKTAKQAKGELLAYQWWDQPETVSAVSFCTIAYFAENS